MDEYDISAAFEEIEAELIRSMARNFRGHRDWELSEGFDWPMWQAEQLKALEVYRRKARRTMGARSDMVDRLIDKLLEGTFQDAAADQERKILSAIRRGVRFSHPSREGEDPDAFFRTNARKLEALRESVRNDLKSAETATLRMAEDVYRKTIFGAHVYANTGAGTLWQAVDMATKAFLAAGLGSVRYRDGRQVNAASYAEMAIRTANKRAYLTGEGAMRQAWGLSLVIVTRRGTGCPYCVQWQGRVYIDDVWSGGRPDGEHPLLSEAIAGGLYHPNCKDSHTTYFPGVSTEPSPLSPEQQAQMVENYNLQQKQRYYERQVRKYKRLEEGSVDPASVEKYRVQREEWQTKISQLVASHPDVLRREHARERVRGRATTEKVAVENTSNAAILDEDERGAVTWYTGGSPYDVNRKLRDGVPLSEDEEATVRRLNSALNKLPVYQGLVTRDMSFVSLAEFKAFAERYSVGSEVLNTSFVSATASKVYQDGPQLRMLIKAKGARDLRAFNPEEAEVLFPRGTTFKVNAMRREKAMFVLEVEEI